MECLRKYLMTFGQCSILDNCMVLNTPLFTDSTGTRGWLLLYFFIRSVNWNVSTKLFFKKSLKFFCLFFRGQPLFWNLRNKIPSFSELEMDHFCYWIPNQNFSLCQMFLHFKPIFHNIRGIDYTSLTETRKVSPKRLVFSRCMLTKY